MSFPFFDLTRQYQTIRGEVTEAVTNIFEKQAFVMGDAVLNFEKEVAKYIGVKHAITCSSGTDALVLAMKAMGIGQGDEVITPTFSFFASTSSILLAGATPVFVDIDPVTFNLDPSLIQKAITKKTKAIMPVHLFGQCADMDPILAISQKNNIPIIEDFAQSIGAQYKGKGAGSMGLTGATSFYPTKNLGGAGEGGLVTTNDDAVAEKAKLLRVHGMKVRYTHDVLGWNSRMDALQTAVLRVKLKYLNDWVLRRQTLAKQYTEAFDSLEKKKLIRLPRTASYNNLNVWNQYVVLVDNRDEVRKRLDEKKIPTDIFYPKTIPEQPVIKELKLSEGSWPVATSCASRALALPIFPELTDDEQKQVIGAVTAVLG